MVRTQDLICFTKPEGHAVKRHELAVRFSSFLPHVSRIVSCVFFRGFMSESTKTVERKGRYEVIELGDEMKSVKRPERCRQ